MLWVLWDIFLPILLAFLAGLFVGWMFWRWRRSRIDAETLSALRRNTTRLKNDAENLRARNSELSDRLQTASVSGAMRKGAGASADGADGELAIAKKRIDTLSSELKTSRLEVNRLREGSSIAGTKTPGKSDNDAFQANRVRDLEARLQGANRRIADLEQSARDNTTSNTASAQSAAEHSDAIAVRDRMIETLKKSLAQYGDSKDLTTLSADLVLRDNKIDALESLLDDNNRNKTR